MSIVQQELTIEDRYSQEVITKASELSEEVKNYLTEERYLVEVDEEALSPLWIRNRVLRILLDDLNEIGIFFNRETDDLLDDVIMHQAIFFLCSKFDNDKLFELIHNNEQLVELLKEASSGTDCITAVISTMNETFPLDEGWEYLANRGVVIGSDDTFVEFMQSIFDKIDSYGDPSYESTMTTEEMVAYLQYVEKRNAIIEKMACSCFPVTVKDPQSTAVITSDSQKQYMIRHYMESYEKQLLRGDDLIQCVRIFHDTELTDDQKVAKFNKLRDKYKYVWKHDIRYFSRREDGTKLKAIMTDAMIALIVASHYQIGMTNDQLRQAFLKTLNDFIEEYPEGSELHGKFQTCLDRMVIPAEETVTNETV